MSMNRLERDVEVFQRAMAADRVMGLSSGMLDAIGPSRPEEMMLGASLATVREALAPLPRDTRTFMVHELEAYIALREETPVSDHRTFAYSH